MTNPVVGRTAFRQSIQKAVQANMAARESLRRIIDDQPGPQTLAILIARAGLALGSNLDALREIERIGDLMRAAGARRMEE